MRVILCFIRKQDSIALPMNKRLHELLKSGKSGEREGDATSRKNACVGDYFLPTTNVVTPSPDFKKI